MNFIRGNAWVGRGLRAGFVAAIAVVTGFAQPAPHKSGSLIGGDQGARPAPWLSGKPTVQNAAPQLPVAARVIVKLRDPQAQSLALALPAKSDAVNLASVSATDPGLAALLAKHGVQKVSPLFAGVVRAQRQQGRSAAQLKSAVQQRFAARAARAPANATSPDLSSTFVFDLGVRPAAEVAATVRALRADSNVLFAEEDKAVHACYIPNDPSYSSSNSWGQGYADLYGLKKIGTTAAWDTTQGQGVVVAVVDTGVDYNHPDIQANIWTNPGEIPGNGIDDDHNGFVDDVHGWDFVGSDASHPVEDNDPYDGHFHGTHVAGTIAATGDNNLGVVGVAWKAKIMPVKGLDDLGTGYESMLARAIVYAVDNGADVINTSWGGGGTAPAISDAISYGHALGVVFVAAAGNDHGETKNFFPANVPETIAVAALDPFDNQAFFSNFGSKVELAAPGQDILSLQAHTTGYMRLEGTSMAAPHVSGVAALIIAQHPTFSSEQIRQALRISATDLGPAGKDSTFGYGRVDAAAGVLVTHALEARIFSPADVGVPIASATPLIGSAGGPGFDHYVVDFGAGATPVSWTVLRSSTVSVSNGDIGNVDPSTYADGLYTVRLRVFETGGAVYSDQIQIYVQYLEITSPLPPAVYSLTQEVKPGVALQITGSAQGPSFQNYVLEWAPGVAATSGWSTAGVSLPGGGLAPVTSGVLGTWTPSGLAQGDYTVRLTVTDSGFSSMATTNVYAEPALVSSGFPKLIGPAEHYLGAQPVRQVDGSTRFLLSGFPNPGGAVCSLVALDGSITTAPLDFGGETQAAVGNLDGQPGDEVVIADGLALKIFSSSLAPVRTITTAAPRVFWVDQTILADLDNDGIPEIIAPARDTQALDGTSYRQTGALYVYRPDGSLFSNHYPLTITSPLSPTGGYDRVATVAVDLAGDGHKEIVMAIEADDYSGYTVKAFNADGTPYGAFTTLNVPGFQLLSLSASDLDHDGTSELVIGEVTTNGLTNEVRVVNSTGTVRPGWPIDFTGVFTLAIGDLDRDGRHEIVVATAHLLMEFRDNGLIRSSHAIGDGSNFYTAIPLVADVDGDGRPEILLGSSTLNFDAPKPYYLSAVEVRDRDGALRQSWPVFGISGQQPDACVPLVGDFFGDGRTVVVGQVSLIEGGGDEGFLTNSGLTCLNIGTGFNAAASDWTGNFRDPQNSRTVTGGVAANDFNQDGRSDLIWQNTTSGDCGFWLMNRTTFASWVDVGLIAPEWHIAATADFNGDGRPDIVWENTVTGDRGFWLMNGTAFASWVDIGIVSTDWRIAAVGDFNNDGQNDILWENTVTGDRGFWLMYGTTFYSWWDIGVISPALRIVGAADFNHDGWDDIVWENTSTGKRVIWFMYGTVFSSSFSLGIVSTDWHIAALADYNGDGKPDILWENTVSGDRGFWLMNGTTFSSWVDIGVVSTDWRIAP